jgi:5-methylcytosine-specific restriction enzyme subunit McrC
VLKAQNYVGLIQLEDGLQVEILPKVLTCDISTTKRVFFEMLSRVSNVAFKRLKLSNVDTTQGTLLDVYIETFLAEVDSILKGGMYSKYRGTTANEKYLNGKLLVSKNVQENYAHRERFYIKYDTYTPNCSENRLLKSTLVWLDRVSHSASIKSTIRSLLHHFDGVELSTNYAWDFANCTQNRNNRGYQNALNIAKVFLKRETFTNYSGDGIAYALLFPMDTIFERYVANLVQSSYPQYSVTPQDTTTHLLGEDFLLKPDIVVRDGLEVKCIIDTKWKVLDDTLPHYGIDIKDIYQAYVYAQRFNCKGVVLLYPKPNSNIKGTTYTGDGVSINIHFLDLYSVAIEHSSNSIFLPNLSLL